MLAFTSFVAFALALAPVVTSVPTVHNLARATPAPLRACASSISSNPPYYLTREVKISKWIQCEYTHVNPDGGTSGNYCFYHASDYQLTHYPDTPLRVDSHRDCPAAIPLAGSYLLKSSSDGPGTCITAVENKDGAKVALRRCDGRHNFPGQKWAFTNGQIRVFGDKCLDVPNGSTQNGAKLQIWTCANGNTNQQFNHSGGDVLDVPEDTITWATHPGKCLDLTNGSQNDLTPIQIWDCYKDNRNQVWTIDTRF